MFTDMQLRALKPGRKIYMIATMRQHGSKSHRQNGKFGTHGECRVDRNVLVRTDF